MDSTVELMQQINNIGATVGRIEERLIPVMETVKHHEERLDKFDLEIVKRSAIDRMGVQIDDHEKVIAPIRRAKSWLFGLVAIVIGGLLMAWMTTVATKVMEAMK